MTRYRSLFGILNVVSTSLKQRYFHIGNMANIDSIPNKIGNCLLLMLVQWLSKSCVSLIGFFVCFCFINFVFVRNSKVPIKTVFYLFIKNISVKDIFNDFVLPFKKLIFHIFTRTMHIHSFFCQILPGSLVWGVK